VNVALVREPYLSMPSVLMYLTCRYYVKPLNIVMYKEYLTDTVQDGHRVPADD